jgi:hypothetical protein
MNCGLRISDCGLKTELQQMRNEPNSSIAESGQISGGTPALRPAASTLRRTKRAKQTQFLAAEIPQRSTVLSFHHSRPIPIVQDKAKLGQDGTSGERCLREANRAKQSQFPVVPGGTGPEGRGTRGNRAKQTQFPASRAREASREINRAKQTRLGRASGGDAQPTKSGIVRNEANLGRVSSVNLEKSMVEPSYFELYTSDLTLSGPFLLAAAGRSIMSPARDC